MSYVKIMVHCVWGTKYRKAVLTRDIRDSLFSHIRENARSKDIYIDTIGGYVDHVHGLISLGSEQSISKVIQLIKGESSFWANQQKLLNSRFGWADDYYAASISKSHIQRVRNYINNQEQHHNKISFNDEFEKLVNGNDKPWLEHQAIHI